MATTSGLAEIFIAIELSVGAIIGLTVVALVYRSRFGTGLAVRGAFFGGVAFLVVSGVAGWADFREDLWLWNRHIAENRLVLCVIASFLAALLAGARFGRTHAKT